MAWLVSSRPPRAAFDGSCQACFPVPETDDVVEDLTTGTVGIRSIDLAERSGRATDRTNSLLESILSFDGMSEEGRPRGESVVVHSCLTTKRVECQGIRDGKRRADQGTDRIGGADPSEQVRGCLNPLLMCIEAVLKSLVMASSEKRR